jgi:DNA-binding CsgD family transcriptional regulator
MNERTCSKCGSLFLSPILAYRCSLCRYEKSDQSECKKLTRRDREIIGLVGKGKTNKEIAWQLRLTTGTIKEYLYHVFRKLNVTSRLELALVAVLGGQDTNVEHRLMNAVAIYKGSQGELNQCQIDAITVAPVQCVSRALAVATAESVESGYIRQEQP